MLLIMTCFLNVATDRVMLLIHHFSAPAPTSATAHIANLCVAPYNQLNAFYDPLSCHRLNSLKEAETDPAHIRPDQIIFAIRFPHPGLTMTRWFQFIATSIRLEIEYMPEYHYETG